MAKLKTDNRVRLRQLIAQTGMTQSAAAAAITRASDTNVSARALRAWLADPRLPSARPCPGWAIKFLELIKQDP